MSSAYPPPHAQVLVIGGGPSGSYAATALAQEGLDVVLLEAATFPRYHIGESLIPSVRHHLKFIDAESKVLAHGFARKPGAAIKFNQYKKEGYTDFVALGHDNSSWNVTRSEFDKILLDHAESNGVRVFQSTKVTSIDFSSGRPTTAAWAHTSISPSTTDSTGNISFDFLVDASGRAGLISTRYLKNRHFNAGLKNLAMWGYWRGGGVYDETGWAWFIPLANGVTSVGIVRDKQAFSQRPGDVPFSPSAWTNSSSSPSSWRSPTSASSPSTPPSSPPTPFTPGGSLSMPSFGMTGSANNLTPRYMSALELAPGVCALLSEAVLIGAEAGEGVSSNDVKSPTSDNTPHTPSTGPQEYFKQKPASDSANGEGTGKTNEPVRSASDYSYSASTYAGEGFRIIGDAGAFIDPFFSSGVHLAMTGGLAAAASIAAVARGDCTEKEAAEWHSQRIAVSYTRFLVVVMSAYKQMRAQSANVLSDIDEDNFDKAFSFLRPVIQGGADLGPRLSEVEVERAIDFCTDLFNPVEDKATEAVRKRVAELTLSPTAEMDEAADVPEASSPRVTAPPPVQVSMPGRKRSGTMETVWKWIGKVSGSTDSSAESQDQASRKKKEDIFDVTGPLLAPAEIDAIVERAHPTLKVDTSSPSGLLPAADIGMSTRRTADAEETRAVLAKINARRVIHSDHGGLHSLEEEALGDGFAVRLEKGKLGLMKARGEVGSAAGA
ncbi:FAD/NAD(P)-binding domain-containing protein [Artomyces pyxidatus]|uniref:FAD/NAD(P)-binding domain-containing protein n=1 Tax=Artomyces pyxidatus TaxID=48021 RepID=A0ACB8TA63_9AGAM|nr:FAD/NAD(P)-binding domain-containing protein [Artomyces pyxidatus]